MVFFTVPVLCTIVVSLVITVFCGSSGLYKHGLVAIYYILLTPLLNYCYCLSYEAWYCSIVDLYAKYYCFTTKNYKTKYSLLASWFVPRICHCVSMVNIDISGVVPWVNLDLLLYLLLYPLL